MSVSFLLPFCLLITTRFVQAQAPEVFLEIENESDLGSEVQFDISLYAENGHLLNFAQGDLSIAFDATHFGEEVDIVVESGVLKESFHEAMIITLPDGSKAIQLNWNLHQLTSAFPANFTNGGIPQVDPSGVLMGSFRLLGKTSMGDANLSWRSEPLLPTQVWHYREGDHHVEKASATLGDGSILPVELLGFVARKGMENEVILEWQTAREVNSSHFEIEKQVGGSFTRIGTEAAAGTSETQQGYAFVDRTPMAPVVYYRLKAVDLDGSFEYSQTVEVFFDEFNERYEVYPNPVVDVLTVKEWTLSGEPVGYELTDLRGRILSDGLWEATQGDLKIDMKNWARGTYHLTLTDLRGGRYSTKVVKN